MHNDNPAIFAHDRAQAMRVLTSSETVEWYTPPEWVDPAREVLGHIDLDPASNWAANQWIQADTFYSEGGLERPWFGRVWCNPPYGTTRDHGKLVSFQDLWLRKMEAEHAAGRMAYGIILTKSVPGYAWWERAFRRWPVCLTRERISFLRLNKHGEIVSKGQAKAGSSFWYIGRPLCGRHSQWDLFRRVYEDKGRVFFPPQWPAREP